MVTASAVSLDGQMKACGFATGVVVGAADGCGVGTMRVGVGVASGWAVALWMFGSGGGKRLAEEANVPFLGAILMDAAIVEACDGGKIYAGKWVEAYDGIARALL